MKVLESSNTWGNWIDFNVNNPNHLVILTPEFKKFQVFNVFSL